VRTLFLTAKKFAIDEKSPEITIEHFNKAINNVEFINSTAQEVVLKYLQVTPKKNPKYSNSDVEKASEHETVPFDEKVKEFKSYLEANSFTLNIIATKVYVEKKNVLAAFKEKINNLEESLSSQVFGQEMAIEAICDKMVEASYTVSTSGPKGIYLFLGPPATGKTMLSEIMAKELDGYDGFKIFDMTQYTDDEGSMGLFGSEGVYQGSEEGQLTKYVKKHPKSVIVFDEIEKAHPQVMSAFLMMLSSGKAIDNKTDETINFSETILVFTSNLGSELYNNQNFLEMMKENPMDANSTILDAIGREEKLSNGRMVKAISPEMLSRLSQGQVILFNKLPFSALLNIAKSTILKVQNNFEETFGIKVVYHEFEKILATLIISLAPLIDVRKMKAKLPFMLFDLITDFIRRSDDMIEEIYFSLDSLSESLIDEVLLSLMPEQQTKSLHALFRKNETYSFEIESQFYKGKLGFKIQNLTHKKLTRANDLGGDDGLIFEVPEISFEHVAGHHVAKKRLSEVIKILKEPSRLEAFGIDLPKGMLLYGVPGTGKTMLAKAFANEADLPFIQTTGTEILDIDLMKNIFKKAREYAPSIIFVDEIDAIGTRNGGMIDLRINQFLTELNGFSDNSEEQVFVIAATNLKEKIDPAILRSGRIDLHVEIDTLDRDARKFFIDKLLSKPTNGAFDIEKILTFTSGMTGADLEKVQRESSLYIFRNALDAITQEIVLEQINTIKYGSKIVHKSIEKLMESTAIHEAGHAVISRVLMPEVKIEQITVTPRADALGFVSYDRDTNYDSLTRQDIKNKLCVAFGGREAQLKEYGEEGFDSGASSDLNMATKYAHYAIATLGMGESCGYINVSELKDEKLYQKEIEAELKEWLDEAQKKTKELIAFHWDKIQKLATLLEKQEIVSEAELLELVG